jgi:lipocalin
MNIFTIFVAIFNLLSNPPDIKTVDNFNITKYTGTWHQVYDNNYNKLFINNVSCVRHHYQSDFDTLVHISYLKQDENIFQKDSGVLKLNNDTTSGQLKISLDSQLLDNDYFITKLGPVIDDEYQYAIVTDSFKLSLYVLARNINYFFDNYDDEVTNFLSNTCSNDKTIEYLTTPIKINNDCL